MHRLMLPAAIALALLAPAAMAGTPYRLDTELSKAPGRITGTFKVTRASGPNKGELVAAPRLGMNDGSIGRTTAAVEGTGHKLDIRFIKAKDAPRALVVFLVWNGETLIQAETRQIELE